MSRLRDKPSIVISEPKEASYICHCKRYYWLVGDGFYFLSVSFYIVFRNHMPQVT